MCYKEIGGYIELDTYRNPMLHERGIKLNSGRAALEYLIKSRDIGALYMPRFMCDSCDYILKKNDVKVSYYNIGLDFLPRLDNIKKDDWIYVVNYYGQISNAYIKKLKKIYNNIIVDNAQAYFQLPVVGTDTIYTCRKFFGVTDGAILYTDAKIDISLPKDESFDRMRFILGRFERCASEFYTEYVDNNHRFNNEGIKSMSKLTENLLHGINYDKAQTSRSENFKYLHKKLGEKNNLNLNVPEGGYMYPLYTENASEIRDILLKKKIYIPILWPSVLDTCEKEQIEYKLANNILPLPIDQRYNENHMKYLVEEVSKCID